MEDQNSFETQAAACRTRVWDYLRKCALRMINVQRNDLAVSSLGDTDSQIY